MARLTRREKQEQTRMSLLRAAASALCHKGLQATSIDEIAHRAGYTKGAFYANFKSKEELFLVMLDERFAAQLERIASLLAGRDEAAEEAHQAAEDFMRSLRGGEDWRRLYLEFVAYAMRNDDFRQELAARHRALRAGLSELYTRWTEGLGEQPPIETSDIAAMTDFMADGFLLHRLIDPELEEGLYSTMMMAFVRGLQAIAAGWEPTSDSPSDQTAGAPPFPTS